MRRRDLLTGVALALALALPCDDDDVQGGEENHDDDDTCPRCGRTDPPSWVVRYTTAPDGGFKTFALACSDCSPPPEINA